MSACGPAFSSDGSEVISRVVDWTNQVPYNELHLQIESIVKWVEDNKFNEVALQMPDHMLKHARRISEAFRKRGLNRPSVLGDTTYASCCVDTVTAAHMQCDCLVHFGEACLSKPPSNFPVKFVLPEAHFNLDTFLEKLNKLELPVPASVVLLYECSFQHCSLEIYEALKEHFGESHVLHSELVLPSNHSKDTPTRLGRKEPPEIEGMRLIIFIGSSTSPLLTLWLMNERNSRQERIVYRYDCQNEHLILFENQLNRLLMKRLYLVEKVKDAHCVGIVAAGISIDKHLHMVERVRALCKNNNKKCYTFSVGKLNVAKLSNFATEIDVFVLLSCPMGVLFDTTEYFKPVVSAFELEIALNTDRPSWVAEGSWTTEFERLLESDLSGSAPEERIDVSLLTGKVRILNESVPPETSTTLVQYFSGSKFSERSWQGLEDGSLSEPTSYELKEGRAGIAASYKNEPQK